jgi:cytochrome c oxidase assembly factor CtaG
VRPDPYAWGFHPEPLAFVVALVLAYSLACRRDGVGRARATAFGAGIALLVATIVTPLHALQYHLLLMHLLQNVVLAEWAPALLVLGVPPLLARRVHPSPLLTLPVWLVTYAVWHVPAIYDAALENEALLHLEHLCYLAAGVAFWWPVVHGRAGDIAKAGYVFAAFLLSSPVGLLLALLPDAIYPYYERHASGLWGLDPLQDQQLAGLTMAAEQSVVFFVVFAFYFARFLAGEERAG